MPCFARILTILVAAFLLHPALFPSALADEERPQPRPLDRPQPVYPRIAAEHGVQGWVVVRFSLAEDGTVAEAAVTDSLPGGLFEEEALAAVRSWRYEAAADGAPDAQRSGIEARLTFVLNDRFGRRVESLPRTIDCPPDIATERGPITDMVCREYSGSITVEGDVGGYLLRLHYKDVVRPPVPFMHLKLQHDLRGMGVGVQEMDLDLLGFRSSVLHYRQGNRACARVLRMLNVDPPGDGRPFFSLISQVETLLGSICAEGTERLDIDTIRSLLPPIRVEEGLRRSLIRRVLDARIAEQLRQDAEKDARREEGGAGGDAEGTDTP